MQLNLNFTDDIPHILSDESKKPHELNYLPDDCVIVDVETTGLNPSIDSVIEISAIKVKDNKAVSEFSSLISPKKLIPPFISNLTGITNEMVLNAPDRRKVLIEFCSFIGANPIAGHNIKFDLSFLNAELKREFQKSLCTNYADTLLFARKVYNLKSYKLTNIANFLNINTNNAHRALKDCRMTYLAFKDMKQRLNNKQK